MNNPLLNLDSLPAFDRIEAAHARPALEHILAENRARLKELTAQPAPTFASLVIPVEELGYRLSRVWSPIGHLNAVANSAQMRQAYNECVPLLTAYSSELGQNGALYAGYAYVLAHEGDSLEQPQRKLLENALRDFRLAGVDLPPDRKARYREVMQRLAQLATKFSENVLDAARAFTLSITDGSELAGLPDNALERAAADAREANQPGWLFKLDQPTYMTVMTSAANPRLRRDIYEAWVTRASELGPSAGRFDNNSVIAEILPLRHELALLLGFPDLRRLCIGDSHGEEQQASTRISGRLGAALPAGRRGRSCRISRSSPGASSTRGTWRSSANDCRRAASRCRRKRCGLIFLFQKYCPDFSL